nr:hypothetical protein [Tanacetum cinerariifolium]
MTTLAEFMIIAGANNHPPMLEKSLYDSWKSHMKHYMENMENGRMILNLVQNGPLIWPTVIEEDGLLLDVYAIFNHHKVAKEIWDRVKLLMQGTKLSLQEKECLDVPVFNQGDDLIACLNKAMAFLIVARVVKCYNCQGEGHMARQWTQPKRPRNATWFKEKAMLAEAQEARKILIEEQLAFLADPGITNGQTAQTTILNNTAFQTKDLDAYDSDCDDVSNAKTVLMANLSNYGSDVISEVPHSDSYHNDTYDQSVHAMQDFEQTHVVDFSNEIHSDSNIIPYSQYLQETQQAAVQDTNVHAQQDSMILSMIKQMSEQMIDHVNN